MDNYFPAFKSSKEENKLIELEPPGSLPYSELNRLMKDFSISVYRFNLRVLETILLPDYSGSTLRGAFGWAFRKVCCTRKNEECKDCLLNSVCIYSLVFETPGDLLVDKVSIPQAPRPFVLNIPAMSNKITSGEVLSFQIVLIGRAISYLPYFILAFEEMGEKGLGKGKGKFKLESIDQVFPNKDKPVIYSADIGRVLGNSSGNGWDIYKTVLERFSGESNIRINFVTPGRFISSGHLVKEITFVLLIKSLLRRVTWIGRCHCGISVNFDYSDYINRAEKVLLLEDQTYWYDWERYSQRQGGRMKLGGLAGFLTYGEGWHDFLWLLALGEIIHVGKGATFGLGQYSLEFI